MHKASAPSAARPASALRKVPCSSNTQYIHRMNNRFNSDSTFPPHLLLNCRCDCCYICIMVCDCYAEHNYYNHHPPNLPSFCSSRSLPKLLKRRSAAPQTPQIATEKSGAKRQSRQQQRREEGSSPHGRAHSRREPAHSSPQRRSWQPWRKH